MIVLAVKEQVNKHTISTQILRATYTKKNFNLEISGDLITNFAVVYPSDKISYLVNFHSLMRQKGSKYPFIISNTDRLDKAGTHYWAILDFHPKE